MIFASITGSILSAIATMLQAAFSLLPDSTLTFLTLPTETGQDLYQIGNHAGMWNNWLPIAECLEATKVTMAILVPGLLAYKLANWIYRHIPQVGGFGPGSG